MKVQTAVSHIIAQQIINQRVRLLDETEEAHALRMLDLVRSSFAHKAVVAHLAWCRPSSDLEHTHLWLTLRGPKTVATGPAHHYELRPGLRVRSVSPKAPRDFPLDPQVSLPTAAITQGT